MDYQPPNKRLKLPACVNCGIHTEARFCQICTCLPECVKCHKRLSDGWFNPGSNVCLSCLSQSIERKKYTFDDIFSVTEIPSDYSSRDLEAYILGSSDLILESINQAIQVQRLALYFASDAPPF